MEIARGYFAIGYFAVIQYRGFAHSNNYFGNFASFVLANDKQKDKTTIVGSKLKVSTELTLNNIN